MAEISLRAHEQEVERARAKLAGDLATLRDPAALSAFTADLKQEAVETKNNLLGQAKSAAQSTATGILDDLKAKAAGNRGRCCLALHSSSAGCVHADRHGHLQFVAHEYGTCRCRVSAGLPPGRQRAAEATDRRGDVQSERNGRRGTGSRVGESRRVDRRCEG